MTILEAIIALDADIDVQNIIKYRAKLYAEAQAEGNNCYSDDEVDGGDLDTNYYHHRASNDKDVSVYQDTDGAYWLLNDAGHVSL